MGIKDRREEFQRKNELIPMIKGNKKKAKKQRKRKKSEKPRRNLNKPLLTAHLPSKSRVYVSTHIKKWRRKMMMMMIEKCKRMYKTTKAKIEENKVLHSGHREEFYLLGFRGTHLRDY